MLEQNVKQILDDIKNGNNLKEPITLVAATKTVDVDTINQAVTLGVNVVAENRVQEFILKHDKIVGAEQHFIGHLQTNKVKYLVGNVTLIQSVDSVHLAQAIDKEAAKKKVVQDILIEVNIGGELSKSGFNPDNAGDYVKEITALKNVKVLGLMAMLPKSDDETMLINLCRKMRSLYDGLKSEYPDFKYLSMGMSSDYKVAINCGSNMIRVGSTIFGKRQ